MTEASVEAAVRQILSEIGEDPDRPGLAGTPDRVHRMYAELTAGYGVDPKTLLNDAIFTTPPHPQFAGAALIDSNGHLAGIGSLAVNLSEEGGKSIIANMFVPIDQLSPILEDMVEHGRSLTPRRPWLGLYTNMMRGHLYVDRVAEGGPAQTAGIEEDDIILSVSGEPVSDMADFYRKVWSLGEPGITVSVEILRGGQVSNVDIESADRYDWLRLNPEPSGKNLL